MEGVTLCPGGVSLYLDGDVSLWRGGGSSLQEGSLCAGSQGDFLCRDGGGFSVSDGGASVCAGSRGFSVSARGFLSSGCGLHFVRELPLCRVLGREGVSLGYVSGVFSVSGQRAFLSLGCGLSVPGVGVFLFAGYGAVCRWPDGQLMPGLRCAACRFFPLFSVRLL